MTKLQKYKKQLKEMIDGEKHYGRYEWTQEIIKNLRSKIKKLSK